MYIWRDQLWSSFSKATSAAAAAVEEDLKILRWLRAFPSSLVVSSSSPSLFVRTRRGSSTSSVAAAAAVGGIRFVANVESGDCCFCFSLLRCRVYDDDVGVHVDVVVWKNQLPFLTAAAAAANRKKKRKKNRPLSPRCWHVIFFGVKKWRRRMEVLLLLEPYIAWSCPFGAEKRRLRGDGGCDVPDETHLLWDSRL